MRLASDGIVTQLGPVLVAMMVALQPPAIEAVDIDYPSLSDLVDRSTTIATVSLMSREAVTFSYRGVESVCGHRYRAEVSESLKGSARSVVFFGDGDEDFVGQEAAYLVMIFYRDVREARSVSAPIISSLRGIERAKFLCRLEASEYYVMTIPHTLIPFDREATSSLGGEWLGPTGVSAVSFDDFARKTVRRDDTRQTLTSWTDVRLKIARLVRATEEQPAEPLPQLPGPEQKQE